MLAAASYYRIGFSIYFAVRAQRVGVPGVFKFHLEPNTIREKVIPITGTVVLRIIWVDIEKAGPIF